jgi:hypothetical protein
MSNSKNTTQRVDVQFHFSPDFYTGLVKKTGKYITTGRWSVQGALDYMDRCNIGAGMLSVSTPSVNFLPVAESIALARRLNDAAAKVAHDHPGRFGNFATLPMLNVDATLTEIAYCYDTLKWKVFVSCQMLTVYILAIAVSSPFSGSLTGVKQLCLSMRMILFTWVR